MNFDDLERAGSSLISIFCLIVISIYPCVIYLILVQNFQDNEDAKDLDKLKKMQTLIKDFRNPHELVIQLFPCIQLLRKLSYALIMVSLSKIQSLQVHCIILNSLLSMIYLINFKPYQEIFKNRLECLNELFILMVAYTFIIFSDANSLDYNSKMSIDYFPIAILILLFIINIGVVYGFLAVSLFSKFKGFLVKRRI